MPAEEPAPPRTEPELLPPWRPALDAALQRGDGVAASRYLQLATLGGDGRPRNRTVVFRGFGPDSTLLVLSDTRSRKAGELAHCAQAALAWYFPVTREQFRLEVVISLHGADSTPPWSTLRQQLWAERGARGQAEWLDRIPSQALPTPVEAFLLLVCRAHRVEHLELDCAPHRETRHEATPAGWLSERLRGT